MPKMTLLLFDLFILMVFISHRPLSFLYIAFAYLSSILLYNIEMKIRENIPISTLTTMRLGGNARYVIDIEAEEDVPEAYKFADEHELPVYVLGSGSNIIGRDKGFNGVILVNKIRGMGIENEEYNGRIDLYSFSGELLDDFVRYSTRLGFSGIEALSAIPGTVGAAPVQNVGAYGQDISQTIVTVRAYDTLLEDFVEIPKIDMDLSYRHSIFNSGRDIGRYFITRVVVCLKRTELKPPFYNSLQKYLDDNNITDYSPETIRKAVRAVREAKLPDPDEIASSGSFFKNVYLNSEEEIKDAEAKGIPVWDGGKIPSGWLVENAGLKGQLFHGMRVWDKASLVLVNENAQNYADLAAARKEIIERVREKYGYTLEQEPMELGE